jgi:hypothetical protein
LDKKSKRFTELNASRSFQRKGNVGPTNFMAVDALLYFPLSVVTRKAGKPLVQQTLKLLTQSLSVDSSTDLDLSDFIFALDRGFVFSFCLSILVFLLILFLDFLDLN